MECLRKRKSLMSCKKQGPTGRSQKSTCPLYILSRDRSQRCTTLPLARAPTWAEAGARAGWIACSPEHANEGSAHSLTQARPCRTGRPRGWGRVCFLPVSPAPSTAPAWGEHARPPCGTCPPQRQELERPPRTWGGTAAGNSSASAMCLSGSHYRLTFGGSRVTCP